MVLRQGIRCLACGVLVGGGAAHASTLEVTDRGCGRGVEIVAEDAPLTEVWERLAATLGFRLEVDGTLAGTVRLRETAPPRQLLARLLASQPGHVVWHARDPRCPGQDCVTRVRLVVAGAASGASLPAPAQPAPEDRTQPAPATVTVVRAGPITEIASPQRLREAEQESQRRKAEYDAYVRRHGEAPPGVEEEAARP